MTLHGPGCVKTHEPGVFANSNGCLSMPGLKQINYRTFDEVGFQELFLLRRFHTARAGSNHSENR